MSEVLLEALGRRANHRGLVIARDSTLAEDLRVSPGDIYAALRKLEEASLVELLSPPPFLVVRLRTWPGRGGRAADMGASAYSYSQQLLRTRDLKDSYRPDELAAHDGLLHEILEVLGEDDPASFRKAVDLYAPHVIRTALDRVRRAKNIRKNRTALFRHLLPRIAKESHIAS